jgi:hypothetical protein
MLYLSGPLAAAMLASPALIPVMRHVAEQQRWAKQQRMIADLVEKHPHLFHHTAARQPTLTVDSWSGLVSSSAAGHDCWDDEAEAERKISWLRRMKHMAQDEGAVEIDKKAVSNDSYFGFAATLASGLVLKPRIPTEVSCSYVDTDEVEEIEVVEVPAEVREAYRTTVTRPKQKRVCARLSGDELEGVL